jgi:hypothetical protein
MHRLLVAMTTFAALAVVPHLSPCVSAATINVSIGSVTWFLGGTFSGSTNGRGHAPRFNSPRRCAFTNNGSLLIADSSNNKIRRVVQPRDDLVENWMGNGANADVNGVGTAASFTLPQDIAVMANNTFAFVVEGHAISQINVAASLKSAFVGVSSVFGTEDGSGTVARFRFPLCITIFHATTTLFVGEFPRIRQVSRAGDTSVLSGDTSTGFADGNSATARYDFPQGITTAQSALIVFVTDSSAIRRISSTGTCLTIAGSTSAGYEDGPAGTAAFNVPSGVVLDKFEQSLYIADLFNNVVRRLDLTTMMVYTVIGTGDSGWTSAPISYNAAVLSPRGLCIDPVSQRLFVTGANALSFAEMYTLTTTGSLVTSTSKTGTNTLSLTASASMTGTNTPSLTASTSKTGTNTLSLTASTIQAFPGGVNIQDRNQHAFPDGVSIQDRNQHAFPGGVNIQDRNQHAFPGGVNIQDRNQHAFPDGVNIQDRNQHAFPDGVNIQDRNQHAFPGGVNIQDRNQHAFPGGVNIQDRNQHAFPGGVNIQDRNQHALHRRHRLNRQL